MITPKFDKSFLPVERALKAYENEVSSCKNSVEITVVVERNGGYNYIYSYRAFPDGTGHDEKNYRILERLVKSILWVAGGFRVGISGSEYLYTRLKEDYRAGGKRSFDAEFMSGVYERPFEVCYLEKIPAPRSCSQKTGGNLDGCRIGFDAGGSDRKVSAVVDGKVVYSEEVVWNPKTAEDPHYHFDGILTAMKTAANKMPRVDCIGVSSAGVYIDNKIMVASLFLKVDKKKWGDYIKNMYVNVAKEIGDVPLVVANDGDVTALAGSMSYGECEVLGIAMGTSEAAGYINSEGGVNGWLSELAFAPVDMNEHAMQDEWSGDVGVGCKYFSQDAVVKLAEAGGHTFAKDATPAEKLKEIQKLMEEGSPLARTVYEDIGIYLGHTLPFYARFYPLKRVLLLGRVTGGAGGNLILESCKRVIKEEYPSLLGVEISLPDEKSRRVGQSIAAASLPELKK